MTETEYRANIRAHRYDEMETATETLNEVTARLERELKFRTESDYADMTEYAAMVNAYVQAERLYLDILKEGAESE